MNLSLGKEHVAYQRLDLPLIKVSVVGGRPFSCGGKPLFRKKLLSARCVLCKSNYRQFDSLRDPMSTQCFKIQTFVSNPNKRVEFSYLLQLCGHLKRVLQKFSIRASLLRNSLRKITTFKDL